MTDQATAATTSRTSVGRTGAAIAVFLILWGGSTAYLAFKGADWTFPIISLGLFGIALSGVVWLLTLRAKPAIAPVAKPGAEFLAMVVYLVIYAVAFLVYGMSALRSSIPAGPLQELAVLGVKLVVHVALPAAILMALGSKITPLFFGGPRALVFWRTLIVMAAILLGVLSVVSPSLQQIADLKAPPSLLAWAIPATFIWLALEAGLCEEFLFRAVLQTRAEAVLKSPIAAILATSVLFGLGHAPGLYLRGGPGVEGWSSDPLEVAAFAVSTLAPLSVLFGVIWMRTRSLLLCVLLHATVDVLPGIPRFVGIWAS